MPTHIAALLKHDVCPAPNMDVRVCRDWSQVTELVLHGPRQLIKAAGSETKTFNKAMKFE